MAMFVLVVDTSLMNVSISAVVHDLDTTASGVQSAIALAGNRSPSEIILAGFLLLSAGVLVLIPIVPRADSGWWMVVPLLIAGCGLGLLASQLNNYTLTPIEEERVSEAAGVNSAGGSFGLSFGLAFAGAIMLASLSLVFSHYADSSKVLSPAEQQRVSEGLEKNAEVMTNTHRTPRSCSSGSRPTCRRKSTSTPTPDRGRCRSRCRCRSWPPCSGS
jgi:xanthine/uracil permease